MEIKIGDRVKSIGHYEGLEGVVTKIIPGLDEVSHGMVEVRVTNLSSKKFSWLSEGSLELFCHFGWEKILQVLP